MKTPLCGMMLAIGLVCLIGSSSWAAGNVQNGRAIASQQCSNCHLIGKNEVNALETQPYGPDFMTIKGLTATALKTRLNQPHPVMSKFPNLSDQQIDDLVAYISSLKS
jgi:cytochrome c553